MTVKKFFKSAAFKSLAVLLGIVIVAGALLAIFSDLLAVSDEERLARSLKKIYGNGAEYKEVILGANDEKVTISDNTVNQAYLMSDGNYLIQTTGTGGWSNGTITVWTIFDCDGSKAENNLKWNGIERVVYESNDKQSYIGRFSEADYKLFASHNAELLEGKLFGSDITVVKTGASSPFTFSALTGAVNCAVTYFKQNIVGVASEPDIYKYQSFINVNATTVAPDISAKTVTYNLSMKGYGMAPVFTVNVTVTDGKITSFATSGNITSYDDDGIYIGNIDASLKDGSFFNDKTAVELEAILKDDGTVTSAELGAATLHTGASNSSTVLLRAALFALANYEDTLYQVAHKEWIGKDEHEVSDNIVTYKLSMKSFGMAPAFTVNITVTDGKITSFATSGNITSYDDDGIYIGNIDASLKDGSFFNDKTAVELEAILKDDGTVTSAELGTAALHTGASNSSTVLLRAAIYALSNYNVFLMQGGTQE